MCKSEGFLPLSLGSCRNGLLGSSEKTDSFPVFMTSHVTRFVTSSEVAGSFVACFTSSKDENVGVVLKKI